MIEQVRSFLGNGLRVPDLIMLFGGNTRHVHEWYSCRKVVAGENRRHAIRCLYGYPHSGIQSAATPRTSTQVGSVTNLLAAYGLMIPARA